MLTGWESAKSSRSKCQECHRKILQGEQRMWREEVARWAEDEYVRRFVCKDCAPAGP